STTSLRGARPICRSSIRMHSISISIRSIRCLPKGRSVGRGATRFRACWKTLATPCACVRNGSVVRGLRIRVRGHELDRFDEDRLPVAFGVEGGEARRLAIATTPIERAGGGILLPLRRIHPDAPAAGGADLSFDRLHQRPADP